MWNRFPPRMRRAISGALEEAGRRGHELALPEHLLLRIAADRESAAVFMLEQSGVSPNELIDKLSRCAAKDGVPQQRAERFASTTMQVLDLAIDEADRREDLHVGTEHFALALTRIDGNLASTALRSLGFTREKANIALRRWAAQGMPRRRGRFESFTPRSKILRAILRPAQKVARFPTLAWNVYSRHSLAHPKFVTDPYPLYRKLRETQPVRRDPLAPVWVVTRYAETLSILRDPRFRKDPFADQRLPQSVREQLAIPANVSPRTFVETLSMLTGARVSV